MSIKHERQSFKGTNVNHVATDSYVPQLYHILSDNLHENTSIYSVRFPKQSKHYTKKSTNIYDINSN